MCHEWKKQNDRSKCLFGNHKKETNDVVFGSNGKSIFLEEKIYILGKELCGNSGWGLKEVWLHLKKMK